MNIIKWFRLQWEKLKPFPSKCPWCSHRLTLYSYDHGFWRWDCTHCPLFNHSYILAGFICFVNQSSGNIIRQIKCFEKYYVTSTFENFPDSPNADIIGTTIYFKGAPLVELSHPIRLDDPKLLPEIESKVNTYLIFS